MVCLDEKNLNLQGSFIIKYRNSTVQIRKIINITEEISVVDSKLPLFQLSAINSKISGKFCSATTFRDSQDAALNTTQPWKLLGGATLI